MCWTDGDQRAQDEADAWDSLCEHCQGKVEEKLRKEGKDSLFDFEWEAYGLCPQCIKQMIDEAGGEATPMVICPMCKVEMEVGGQCPEGGRIAISEGCFQLPIVSYRKKEWFFDDKLRQLRNVRNPHDFIYLNDFEVEYFKDKVRSVRGNDS